MKAYRYTSASGAGAIALAETATPEPGPGEVRLRMAAASLNARDLLMLAAAGRGEVKDRSPLSDGAGVIDAVGPGARRWSVGARVATSFFREWIDGPFRAPYAAVRPGRRCDRRCVGGICRAAGGGRGRRPGASLPRRGNVPTLRGGDGVERPGRACGAQGGRHAAGPGHGRRGPVRAPDCGRAGGRRWSCSPPPTRSWRGRRQWARRC